MLFIQNDETSVMILNQAPFSFLRYTNYIISFPTLSHKKKKPVGRGNYTFIEEVSLNEQEVELGDTTLGITTLTDISPMTALLPPLKNFWANHYNAII